MKKKTKQIGKCRKEEKENRQSIIELVIAGHQNRTIISPCQEFIRRRKS
jgi:hypothetical protein